MFYEKNVIRITYANKSLHLFSENQFIWKNLWENGCPVNGQAFSQLAKSMNASLRRTELFKAEENLFRLNSRLP